MSSNYWTLEEEELILANNNNVELALILCRSSAAIDLRRRQILDEPINYPEGNRHGMRWSIEEEQILLENYNKVSSQELVNLLRGRKLSAIRTRYYRNLVK